MIRFFLIAISFVSLLLFPWPFSVILTLAASIYVPFLPIAMGLFADTLYYTSKTEALPLLTLYGAITTGIALIVHNRISNNIIRK